MADLTLRVLTPEESDVWAGQYASARTLHAWQRWRQHLCEEWGGPHPFQLGVDDGQAYVQCARDCGASPPDADLPMHMDPIPVTWTIERDANEAGPWGPAEVHYVWIEVTPRG